jgi:hypothetical protein
MGHDDGFECSNFGVAKEIDTEAALEALIVKEPVTVQAPVALTTSVGVVLLSSKS